MRDTACAPKPPTNPKTGHQMSRQGLTQNEQKRQFQAKFGRFWETNPDFYWRNQKFGTHITEKPTNHLDRIVFWSNMGRKGQKMPIFGPKRPKMHILDQIWPFLGQKS